MPIAEATVELGEGALGTDLVRVGDLVDHRDDRVERVARAREDAEQVGDERRDDVDRLRPRPERPARDQDHVVDPARGLHRRGRGDHRDDDQHRVDRRLAGVEPEDEDEDERPDAAPEAEADAARTHAEGDERDDEEALERDQRPVGAARRVLLLDLGTSAGVVSRAGGGRVGRRRSSVVADCAEAEPPSSAPAATSRPRRGAQPRRARARIRLTAPRSSAAAAALASIASAAPDRAGDRGKCCAPGRGGVPSITTAAASAAERGRRRVRRDLERASHDAERRSVDCAQSARMLDASSPSDVGSRRGPGLR